jgi:ribonuclease J
VIENGQIVEFVDGEMRLGERIPGDYIFVDGSGVGDVDERIVQERETLGRNGIMVVNLDINRKNGRLRSKPEIITRGFMMPEESGEVMGGLQKELTRAVKNANGDLEKAVIRSLKSYLYDEIKRSPMIFVTVNQD